MINPDTGETWLNRNLGAISVATSSTDAEAYGDLYQWGRAKEGHQKRSSSVTTTYATTSVPNQGNPWDALFVSKSSFPQDWLIPQNTNLWQGISGINNPCPEGFRVPTAAELNVERLSWSSNNAAGAFASPLKFTLVGLRGFTGGIGNVGVSGYYWSSTVNNSYSKALFISSNSAEISSSLYRVNGISVRCIMN